MNRAPSDRWCTSHACFPGLSAGAYAPVGAPALRFTATDRPTTTTERRQAVGDTPLLTLAGRNSCRQPAEVVDSAHRPSLPLSDMLFAAAFKTYSTVSARRFMTDLSSAQALGLIDKTPHYNSIFNVLDKESVTPILHELITRSALPLRSLETAFAIDSTGFGVQSFYRHYSAKYGHDQNYRDFLKLHAMIGTKTNVIACAQVTDRNTHDSPILPALIETTAQHFTMTEVSADKAYSSRKNLELIDGLGAAPMIPFKKNTKASTTSALWNKLFHFFEFNRDEFLPMYHKRSNAESTFSALKRKFGDTLRSKTDVARRNELLLMVLCHNIVCVIHEIEASGVAAMFPALCPRNADAAQEAAL